MSEYVLRTDKVIDCMWDVADAKVHRHFPGYLCVKRLAEREGSTTDLEFKYDEFFDTFFWIRDPPDPYFVPFKKSYSGLDSLWFGGEQANVAGTYSEGSIRDGGPFDRTVAVEKRSNTNYASLRDETSERHWEKAKENLTSQSVPATALAGFLYRDFSIIKDDDEEPSGDDLVDIFRDEFGYDADNNEQDEQFDHLYTTDDITLTSEDFTDEF